jgi:type VII secretion protein EccE
MSVTASPRAGDVSRARRGEAGRPVLVRRRRPGYLGPIHILQLLIVELAIFGAFAAFAFGALAGLAAALVALGLVGLTLARWRGRWLVERRVMAWRFRRRQRLVRAAGPPTEALSVLRRLSPELSVENVPMPGGVPVGVARDDAGWFAAAAITPSLVGGEAGRVPLDLIAASIAESDQAGAVVQVVVQTVPAVTQAAPNSAEQSYRELVTSLGTGPLMADRATWVVIRIDARGLAEAIGDHNADISSAPTVVASLLRRLVTSLRQVGVSPRMLDADGLLTALLSSCDPEPAGAAALVPRERWTQWQATNLSHRTFWIRTWPDLRHTSAMFDALFAVPAAATTVSLILDPEPRSGLVELTGLVRVSASPRELDRTAKTLVRAARKAKADLFPLDGEQAPATYASAPTGGGVR